MIKELYNSSLGLFFSIIIFCICLFLYIDNRNYKPIGQFILLDSEHKPIGNRSLLADVYINNGHPKSNKNGELAVSLASEALLDMFNYDYLDFVNGETFKNMNYWLSERIILSYYEKFKTLTFQKIVMAQKGIVSAEILGLELKKRGIFPYIGVDGIKKDALTYLVEGKMILTIHGYKEDYPIVYNVQVVLQRASIKDRQSGYQIISIDLI
jgi:hypothetical protein